jgi:hypothetical protein
VLLLARQLGDFAQGLDIEIPQSARRRQPRKIFLNFWRQSDHLENPRDRRWINTNALRQCESITHRSRGKHSLPFSGTDDRMFGLRLLWGNRAHA